MRADRTPGAGGAGGGVSRCRFASLPSLDFFAALLFLPAAVTPPVKVARGTGTGGKPYENKTQTLRKWGNSPRKALSREAFGRTRSGNR